MGMLTALLVGAGILAAKNYIEADMNSTARKNQEKGGLAKNTGDYTNASSIGERVTDYITKGGKPEYQTATSQPKTFTVYNQPLAKQNGSEYGTFEYYPVGDGTYTRDLSKVANISLDEKTGRINVRVPDKWKDDEKLKSYIDNTMLKTLSGNYRNNKNVEYPDPYDETKKIKTQEYVQKLNEGLKFRVGALEATAPSKVMLIQYFGGDDSKNAAIDKFTAEDAIIMNLTFDDNDSWVPLPDYMIEAYPWLKELKTYNNGFVTKEDFLENAYNIESGRITEREAYGIATTPMKMLNKYIGEMSSEQIARNVAFARFIAKVDPKRSPISQFLQAGEAGAQGFYGAVYDHIIDDLNIVSNIANLSFINGNSVDVRDFMDGYLFGENSIIGAASSDKLQTSMQQMAVTNKNALTNAQVGYTIGDKAAGLAESLVTMIAIGDLTNAVTTKITNAGAVKIGQKVAEQSKNITDLASADSASISANINAWSARNAVGVAARRGAVWSSFFKQSLSTAFESYSKAVGGMTGILGTMHPAQFASTVNSAAHLANALAFTNTAASVLGSMVMSAVVANKSLTLKVVSGKGTSDEAKQLVQNMLFDAAKIQAMAWAMNTPVAGKYTNKFSNLLEKINTKASQKVVGFTQKITSPYLKFMKWYTSRKAAAAAAGGKPLSNAAAARAESIKESVLSNEAMQYGSNLSLIEGSAGYKMIQEALAEAGINVGTDMAETISKLSKAGIVFDPATLGLSEYEGWQADFAQLQNTLTTWGDVNTNISKVVSEFTNPDIQPVISQQMSEIEKANSKLLNLEQSTGLIDSSTIKTNKKLGKADEGYLYSLHSPELSRYIVRRYELQVIINQARKDGITDLNTYQPYLDAKERYINSMKGLSDEIMEVASKEYIPALTKAEYEIVNVMMDDGVYPRAFVEGVRASGKYGKNGEDWMRLVSRKDLPKGTYDPYSKTVKRDNTIALNRFEIADDEDITWPGNGLQELITEYAAARAEKEFLDAAKKATGLTTQVEVSGKETLAAGRMEEFQPDFERAVKKGFSSFAEEVEGTVAIGKKRAMEQKEFFNEAATIGGVQTVDIDALRAVMREKGLPMADSIVDQQSLDKFLAESSDEAKKLLLDVVGVKPKDNIVSDYSEKLSLKTLDKRNKIAKLDGEIAIFTNLANDYRAGINFKSMDGYTSTLSDDAKSRVENFIRKKVENGEAAAVKLGYKGKPEKFNAWAEKKLASMNKKRNSLIDKVLDERGSKRPTIKFEGDFYSAEDAPYIAKRSKRQEISDNILGSWNDQTTNDIAQQWLVDEDISVKGAIREAIESNPELRSATLSTMYDNSGSELPYEEWLNTPMTITRQQQVDSLRPEDAFLSFSMNKDWKGVNGADRGTPVLTGDIVTLEVKPKDTLGQIPQNIDNEGEAEVLVPREVYATAMNNYDTAMASDEMARFEQTIKDMEAEIAERSPVENAQEFIPTLSYRQRKELAQKVVEHGKPGEYTILYRMQGGTPDQWRANNRGKNGEFIGRVGELEGAVWLTSDPDWVEGPERATAGVQSEFTDGAEVTDDNIVVIPVKKSDILDNTYDGGEEYKDETILRGKIENNGKKIIQTRATENVEAVERLQEMGIAPRNMDHTDPANATKTEFILFKQDHPEVLSDGMELMLQEYNKQFDNRINQRAIERLQRDINTSRESIDTVIEDILENEQFFKLNDFKAKNVNKYEKLMENVDRANAANNDDVKQSQEVQLAADEYRKNIKDFQDSTFYSEKFSYLAKMPAAKGSLQEYAETNGLNIPNDKRSLKTKVKIALWEKVQAGEEIPTIKGLKKTAISKDMDKKEFYKMLDDTELFKNPGGANPLKYELDNEALYNDIDDAIDGMMELIHKNPNAELAIKSMAEYLGGKPSEARFQFSALCEILSDEGKKIFGPLINQLAHKIVDGTITRKKVVIVGNLNSLYDKVEGAIYDKLESRLALAKSELESLGESAESVTITELLRQYRKNINAAEDDDLVVKTTDKDGNIQYEHVSPSIAAIYNERPVYKPLSSPMQIMANLALLKKINTTDLSFRSFAKQSFSDPAMAFATVGAVPGTLQALRGEIGAQFGQDILNTFEKVDPARYRNIELIAQREGISLQEALARNLKAIADVEVPFSLLNSELLRQAKVSKYGNKVAKQMNRRQLNERFNDALRKVSDKLGTPQNKRETYNRILAGETAYLKALRRGFGVAQAEVFREHAINTATTNFRIKHSMFNFLRSTVPYLTSGISGAKSFWRMFEMDPIGVTSRIFTGFIAPIIYFMGEILNDEEAKKKYEALSEDQKENHIAIYVGGELILIPVGEEIGQYTNVVNHLVETAYNENKYAFWSLMLNDVVNMIPGIDLTGFTDPELWGSIAGSPSFPDIIENGISKALASSMPPLLQSGYMIRTGRDLYTGKKIDTSYVTIDEDGNPVIMTYTTSQFAKAVGNLIGGDPRVVEKVTSTLGGPVTLHVLDAITSAIDYVGSGGESGSLTTIVDKATESLAKPFNAEGYSSLEQRFNSEISALFNRKDEIVHGDPKKNEYQEYNDKIARETDPEKRQKLKAKRNDLLTDFYKDVETLVKNYRDAGGSLDKWAFSKVVSLITFEDAVRADRQFMDLNTQYGDAYKQAMQTLYNMGIENPEGPSSLGYIYTDDQGKAQIKMWTPTQIQIMQNAFYEGKDVYRAQIEMILDDGTEDSIKNLKKYESDAEQKFWDKYNATGKLSDKERDAIDDLRKTYNAQVVIALADYMNTYGAVNILSNRDVIDYLKTMILVPIEYETIKGRNVSSGNGKLNKQQGFAESYIKKIFGVN